jgi:hypothetical protein
MWLGKETIAAMMVAAMSSHSWRAAGGGRCDESGLEIQENNILE